MPDTFDPVNDPQDVALCDACRRHWKDCECLVRPLWVTLMRVADGSGDGSD